MKPHLLHGWLWHCVLVLAVALATFGLVQSSVSAQSSASSLASVQHRERTAGLSSSAQAWSLWTGSGSCDGQSSLTPPRQRIARQHEAEPDSPAGHARLVFDPGVSEEDQELIAEAVRLAEDVFATRFGVSFGNAVTVTALPIACPRHEERIASTVGSSMVIYTQSPGWIDSPPAERIRTVIHEYTHVYQHVKTDGVPYESAAWFEEGVAEYLSMVAMSELGLMDRQAVEGLFGEIVHHTDLPPLEELEDYSAMQAQPGQAYPLAYFGVAQSIQNRPLSSIDAYYTALQEGKTFPEAFESAFGMTPERFYAEFAQFRAANLPTMGYLPAELNTSAGIDQPSAVDMEAAPRFAIPGQQVLVIATAQPGSNCALDLLTPDMAASIQDRDTFANGAGQVFWLVTIPADAPTGEGKAVISCGADPVAIRILIA